jgi:hypothetical protein
MDTSVHSITLIHSDEDNSEDGSLHVNTTLDVSKGSEDNNPHHEDKPKFTYQYPRQEKHIYQELTTKGRNKGDYQVQTNSILKVKDNASYFKRSRFIKESVHCKQFHCMNIIQEKYIINNWSKSASIDIKEILSHSPTIRDNFLSPCQDIPIKEPIGWNELNLQDVELDTRNAYTCKPSLNINKDNTKESGLSGLDHKPKYLLQVHIEPGGNSKVQYKKNHGINDTKDNGINHEPEYLLSIHLDPGETSGHRDEIRGEDHVEYHFNKIIKDYKWHRFKCHASRKNKASPLMEDKPINSQESDIHDISEGYYFLSFPKPPDHPGIKKCKTIP